jgi:hypothetical protein
MMHLKTLGKEQAKPKITRWKAITKLRMETNEMNIKRMTQRKKETKN